MGEYTRENCFNFYWTIWMGLYRGANVFLPLEYRGKVRHCRVFGWLFTLGYGGIYCQPVRW